MDSTTKENAGSARLSAIPAVMAMMIVMTAGCAQESPTDVGGSLLPGGVRTYEVVLDPERFVVRDTSFGGYTDVQASGIWMLANAYDGIVDAHMVGRVTMPLTINVRDASGNTVTDTLPTFFRGRLVLTLDTLAAAGPSSAALRLYQLGESYDPGTATWLLRADSSGVQNPWAEPGGTPGELISEWSWQPGVDSLVVPVDSASLAAWSDTANAVRGFMLELGTADTRLRLNSLVLQVDARSSIDTDTTVTVTGTTSAVLSLITPLQTGTASGVRVGGTPSWRGMLEFRERLDTLRIPCLDAEPGCSVPLSELSVTSANLVFEPAGSPPGYDVESQFAISTRELLVRPEIPLERSPLGGAVGNSRRPLRPAELLPAPGRTIEVPITDYIRRFTDDDDETPSRWLALTGLPESGTFGFAELGGLPRLRLVISVGTELQLR